MWTDWTLPSNTGGETKEGGKPVECGWWVRVYTVFSFFVFKFANEKRITNSFFVFKFANEKQKRIRFSFSKVK